MATFEENSEAMVQLEYLVDKAGVREVLYALAHICGAKAQHVAINWQDAHTAKQWDKQARRLDRIAAATDIE